MGEWRVSARFVACSTYVEYTDLSELHTSELKSLLYVHLTVVYCILDQFSSIQ